MGARERKHQCSHRRIYQDRYAKRPVRSRGQHSLTVRVARADSIKELVQATHIKLTKEEIESISEPYKSRGIIGHS